MRTGKRLGVVVLGSLALTGALAIPGAPAMAGGNDGGHDGGHHRWGYTCTGGEIPSGEYRSITVAGDCSVAAGAVIDVYGDVTVKAGATLDAQSAPSTITIDDDITAGPGSVLGLGCQPPELTGNSAHPCATDPTGHSDITVWGDVTAFKAATVALNGILVDGDIALIGGGSPSYWSVKNNTVSGNITVTGQTVAWIGVMFNKVDGSVRLFNITVQDEHPDAPGVYIVSNTIDRNLVCFGLEPGVSGGFVPGAVNVVNGRAFGQCKDLV